MSRRLFHAFPFTLTVMLILACGVTQAQEETRFVLKLNDDLLSNLRSAGSLSSNVQPQFQGRISMIEIQFEGESQNAPAVDSNAGPSVAADLATVSITESLISEIQQHPVRINVPAGQRDFAKISLAYSSSPTETEPAQTPPPVLNDAGQPIDMNYIKLVGDESMSGGIDGFDQFEIDSRFGKISVPMDQVAGIKFHVDGNDSAVVVLSNGDSVTGKPTIPAIRLKTDWGQADIEPKFIDSLTTSSNAKFVQESTDFGLRWKLKTGTSLAPGPSGGFIGN